MNPSLKNRLIVLENNNLRVTFEKQNGRLISLYNKILDLEIIEEKRLADNYRVLVPREEAVDNYILGRDQKLNAFDFDPDKKSLRLKWEKVSSRTGPTNIGVELETTLGPEEGDVSFVIRIDNPEGQLIEEVNFPLLGGMQGIRRRKETKIVQALGGGGHPMQNLFQEFSYYPYWAVDRPFVIASYPYLFSSFLDVTNGREGLYIGIHDKSEAISAFQMDLEPCCTSEGKWPEPPAGKGTPVGGILFPAIFPFFNRKETFTSPAVVCRFHKGGFEMAAKRHRRWLDTWFKISRTPAWFKDCDSWLTVSMLSGSGRIYYKYNDLPRIAAGALDSGVKCLHIQGHDLGGQDRNYPRFDEIDPRLGTEEELIKAVKAIHKLGMKVIFFMKINKADITDPWFKKELSKYAIKDRYGEILTGGYGYGTTLELSTPNIKKMAQMCPYVTAWQDIIIAKTKYIIEKWGGDGIQFDETCGNNLFCFDETHGHNPSVGVNRGIMELLVRLRQELARIRPDIVIGGEALSDIYFQQMDFSYARYRGWHHNYAPPVSRYMLPETVSTACIESVQYDALNYALMNGHFFALEPKSMHGTIEDFKEMLAYVQEILRIRKKYPEYLWRGRFVYHDHAKVSGGLLWGVFKNKNNPESFAVVLMNRDNHPRKGRIIIPGRKTFKARARLPFRKERELDAPYNLEVPTQSAAVVIFNNSADIQA